MKQIAAWIDKTTTPHGDDRKLESIKAEVKMMTDRFPLYPELHY